MTATITYTDGRTLPTDPLECDEPVMRLEFLASAACY
jgi:hypothetical protein